MFRMRSVANAPINLLDFKRQFAAIQLLEPDYTTSAYKSNSVASTIFAVTKSPMRKYSFSD